MHAKEALICEEKLSKLGKCLQKTYKIGEQEALEVIYEEWDLIEEAFASHMRVEDVHQALVLELNAIYRVA
jgi:hypothetical protein